jgi:hypothetical protein
MASHPRIRLPSYETQWFRNRIGFHLQVKGRWQVLCWVQLGSVIDVSSFKGTQQSRCLLPHTLGWKQIQYPKHNFFYFMEYQKNEKLRKPLQNPIILSTCWHNFERRSLDNILWCPMIIASVSFATLLANWCSDTLLPLIGWFICIAYRTDESIELRT